MKGRSLFYLTLSVLLFSADSLPVSSQSSPTLLVGQNTRNPLSNWTWDNLERILSELQRNSVGDNSLTRLVSFYFPPGFAKGQVALSVYGAGGIEYIVAREGVRIPGLSTARALSFAPSIPLQQQDKYPGISQVPQSLYQQGKIIIVRLSATRFIERFTSIAKSGTKVQLSDGRNVYYSNESACSSRSPQSEFNSSFVCVSSKLGSEENLRILASIMTEQPIETATGRDPSGTQQTVTGRSPASNPQGALNRSPAPSRELPPSTSIAASPEKPAICNQPQTTSQINNCAAALYKQADRRLNEVYKQVISKLNRREREKLIDEQLAWIQRRDASCKDQGRMTPAGSASAGARDACLAGETDKRTVELEKYLQK